MRCYLMRKGHIASVEFLTAGPDEALIAQGRKLFARLPDNSFDGFEVWDGNRRLHVYPAEPAGRHQPDPSQADLRPGAGPRD